MKLYPQTSPDSVQAWTQEDFGYPVDTKNGLETALENIFPASSPAGSTQSAVTISCLPSSSSQFTELKPVPPLKALTQCDFVGSSVETAGPSGSNVVATGGNSNAAANAVSGSSSTSVYYPVPEPGPASSQDIVSTTTAPVAGELMAAAASESVMLKPASGDVGSSNSSSTVVGIDHFLAGDMVDDDFSAIIGNAMTDPQLIVPDSLELGSFTSSDMHDLEAWIEGQSQARLQRIHSAAAVAAVAAAAATSSSSNCSMSGGSNHYGNSASPMLQNLLSAGTASGVLADCGSMPFSSAVSMSARALSSTAGYPGLINGGGSTLHQRIHKPLVSTFSPPSYSSLAECVPHVSEAVGGTKKRRPAARSSVKMPIATEGTKDRPVHRCTICNRGFLNKSNIKVHLRTHTGEKPFKCETCNKAFRQKAHLLKHYHIHKRMTRD